MPASICLGSHRDLFSWTYAGPERFCVILVTFASLDTGRKSPAICHWGIERADPLRLTLGNCDVNSSTAAAPVANGRGQSWLQVWAPEGARLGFPSPHTLQQTIWSNANETFNIHL